MIGSRHARTAYAVDVTKRVTRNLRYPASTDAPSRHESQCVCAGREAEVVGPVVIGDGTAGCARNDIVFVEDLPKTATGKIQRFKLRAGFA